MRELKNKIKTRLKYSLITTLILAPFIVKTIQLTKNFKIRSSGYTLAKDMRTVDSEKLEKIYYKALYV